MAQQEITILRVHKQTRNKLRKRALARRESYDEIINRLLELKPDINNGRELEERKQKLLKKGISKGLVDLLGIVPKTSLDDEKRTVREAIIKRMNE